MSKKIRIIFILIVTILIWVSSNLNFGKKNWQYIIEADAKGYYAYLPAVFIYHDLNFGFFDNIEKQKYYNVNTFYDYRIGWKNQIIDKYYIGVAVAQAPFFFLAHGITHLTGKEPDGYSYWYPVLINIAAIFYGVLGLYALFRWLRLKAISENNAVWAVVICAFGTHLFYYIIGEGGMSHVYSFCTINLWLWVTTHFVQTTKKQALLLSCFLLAMIIITRPVNALIVAAFPFLFHHPKDALRFISANFRNMLPALIIGMVIFACTIGIQVLYYYFATGDFWVYSYGEEGFNFTSPHFWDILFSYKKGLFLYTPICFLGAAIAIFATGAFKKQLIYWLVFFTLVTYILSSWWMWYYGGSFSSRVYIEYLFLFMWPIAAFLDCGHGKKITNGIKGLCILLILVCQIQTYQYRYFQIHWVDMTKEKYWEVFLRIDKIQR